MCFQPKPCCVPLGAYQLIHTRVPGRWPLLMPGVLVLAITPAAGHSLWPAASQTRCRSGFSENGLHESGTRRNLLHSTVVLGHNGKVFKCLGFYYMAGPLPVAFRCLTGLILFSLHITQLLTWQISATLDRCLSNPASACSCLKLITGSRNCSFWCTTFPVRGKTQC